MYLVKYSFENFYCKKFGVSRDDIELYLDGTKIEGKNIWEIAINNQKTPVTDPNQLLWHLSANAIIEWFKAKNYRYTTFADSQAGPKERIITPESREANVKHYFAAIVPMALKEQENFVKKYKKDHPKYPVSKEEEQTIFWQFLEHATEVYCC